MSDAHPQEIHENWFDRLEEQDVIRRLRSALPSRLRATVADEYERALKATKGASKKPQVERKRLEALESHLWHIRLSLGKDPDLELVREIMDR